jgi:hypothetical protein
LPGLAIKMIQELALDVISHEVGLDCLRDRLGHSAVLDWLGAPLGAMTPAAK